MSIWETIPGETPIDDISGLIPKGVTTRRDLNVLEAENIRKAVVRYLAAKPSRRQAPFTLDWIYKLHAHMFGEVWKWAGTKRTSELNIGVPAHQIDVNLQNLLHDLRYWHETTDMTLLEQAVRLHHRAVQVHPFLNGNGRWSRLLANIWLKQCGSPITLWPDDAVGEKSPVREEYLAAVRSADEGDMGPLLRLHAQFTK